MGCYSIWYSSSSIVSNNKCFNLPKMGSMTLFLNRVIWNELLTQVSFHNPVINTKPLLFKVIKFDTINCKMPCYFDLCDYYYYYKIFIINKFAWLIWFVYLWLHVVFSWSLYFQTSDQGKLRLLCQTIDKKCKWVFGWIHKNAFFKCMLDCYVLLKYLKNMVIKLLNKIYVAVEWFQVLFCVQVVYIGATL